MIIKTIVVGQLETNCYVVGDEITKDAFIIDPGDDFGKIKADPLIESASYLITC